MNNQSGKQIIKIYRFHANNKRPAEIIELEICLRDKLFRNRF